MRDLILQIISLNITKSLLLDYNLMLEEKMVNDVI